MKSEIGILVFARLSSRRLPGKALRPMGEQLLVERVLRRAQKSGLPVALATSRDASDDELARLVESWRFPVYRGPLEDVLSRAVEACEALGWTAFFRLCGDRPFFDLAEIEHFRQTYLEPGGLKFDLVSNKSTRLPAGLMTELVKVEALQTLLRKPRLSPSDREHLTAYFYDHPAEFKIAYLPSLHCATKSLSLAVDSIEDWERLAPLCQQNPALDLPTAQAIRLLNQT